MKINEKLLLNIFLISIFLFKIPAFYILPFFNSSFLTSQALARIFILFLFFYHLLFRNKKIADLIKKRKYFIISLFLFFFIQSLSIIPALNTVSFLARYKDVIVSFLAFFVFYFYKDHIKKIINVFIFSLLINFLYQFLLAFFSNFSIGWLKTFIYQKHFNLVLAKLEQGKIYLDTYDEIIIPFLFINLSTRNFIILILDIFFSLFSGIRSRVLMMFGAIFLSLLIFTRKINSRKIFFFIFVFLVLAYFVNNIMIGRYGFSYLTRFLLEEEIVDIKPINFRKTQLEDAFLLAKGNFLGVGLGNFYDNIFSLQKNSYFLITKSQKIAHFSAQEYVHNIFGLILSETGFVGLFIFLLIILWFIKQDFQLFKKNDNNDNKEKKALAIAFWCLFLYGFFNPIVPASYQVLFWGIRGLLI